MEPDRWLGIELRHLIALEAVSREGSFGRAATSLGYTQSAISQQIAMLERIVGSRLIERPGGPKPVSLTEAGLLLLRHAESITARLQAAQADLQALAHGSAGPLRIGTYQSVAERTQPLTPREIAELSLIGNRSCRSIDAGMQLMRASGHEPRVVFRSDDNGTVQGMAAAGMGAALVPRLTVDESDPRVQVLELS